MKNNIPKWKKLAATGIVATLSTGFGWLIRLSTASMHEQTIARYNLEEILHQIESSNIDTRHLAMVLREPPPPLFIFIASIISVDVTVWFYHKILGYLCKSCEQKKL